MSVSIELKVFANKEKVELLENLAKFWQESEVNT